MDQSPLSNISQPGKFFGLGPATADEKKSLLPRQPSGLFREHQISVAKREEKPATQLPRKTSITVGLAAAKLSSEADDLKDKMERCTGRETGKKILLSKAEHAYNQAARAKSLSDPAEDNDISDQWEQISVLYENAGALFKQDAMEWGNHKEEASSNTADMFMERANKMKQKLQKGQPFSPTLDMEESDSEKCTIS